MQTILFYALVVLIWGSTWAAIPMQLNGTAEEVSVALRFILAAVFLYLYASLAGRRVRVEPHHYPMVVLQGLFLFSINYMLVYFCANWITSGLIAVLFTALIPCNAINERIFFKTPITAQVVVAGSVGITGIMLIFWPEISGSELKSGTLAGIALGLGGAMLASLGNMAALKNTRAKLPVLAVNMHAMFWGGVASLVIAALLGRDLAINWTTQYIGALAYLSIMGSAVAFGLYLVLITRIGSAKAAYASVLLPIVALLISSVIEDFHWTPLSVTGVALALVGNSLILANRGAKTVRIPAAGR